MTTKEIRLFEQFLTEMDIGDEFHAEFKRRHMNDENGAPDLALNDIAKQEVFTKTFGEDCTSEPWKSINSLWTYYLAEEGKDSGDRDNTDDTKVPSPPELKFCTRCWRLRERKYWHLGYKSFDYLQTYCKDCKKEQTQLEKKQGAMSRYECVLAHNNLYLNLYLSQELKRNGFNRIGLRHQDEKLFLIFFKDKAKGNIKFTLSGGALVKGAVVTDIKDTMKIAGMAFAHLHVTTNKSKKDSAITIEVLQVLSHDSYVRHPFVTETETKNESEYSDIEKRKLSGDENSSADTGSYDKDMSQTGKTSSHLDEEQEPINLGNQIKARNMKDDEIVDFVCNRIEWGVRNSFPGFEDADNRLARTLKDLGWKLQRPVKVVTYEEF